MLDLVAAFGAGFLRSSLETYLQAFIVAGVACMATAVLVLWIGREGERPGSPAAAGATS